MLCDVESNVQTRERYNQINSHLRTLILMFTFQKQTLDQDRHRAISDKAKHLLREEPNLFAAADKEFEGKLFIGLINHIISLPFDLSPGLSID